MERFRRVIPNFYSIVKDSSADMGVNFNIVQNRPTIKAVCTISIFFKILTKYLFGNTFYIPERKQRDIIFDILNRYLANTVILTRNDYGPFANREICITVLNYTVLILKQNFNKKSKLKKHQTENCSSLNQSQGSFKVGCLNILLKEKLPTELWQDNKKKHFEKQENLF